MVVCGLVARTLPRHCGAHGRRYLSVVASGGTQNWAGRQYPVNGGRQSYPSVTTGERLVCRLSMCTRAMHSDAGGWFQCLTSLTSPACCHGLSAPRWKVFGSQCSVYPYVGWNPRAHAPGSPSNSDCVVVCARCAQEKALSWETQQDDSGVRTAVVAPQWLDYTFTQAEAEADRVKRHAAAVGTACHEGIDAVIRSSATMAGSAALDAGIEAGMTALRAARGDGRVTQEEFDGDAETVRRVVAGLQEWLGSCGLELDSRGDTRVVSHKYRYVLFVPSGVRRLPHLVTCVAACTTTQLCWSVRCVCHGSIVW